MKRVLIKEKALEEGIRYICSMYTGTPQTLVAAVTFRRWMDAGPLTMCCTPIHLSDV